MSGYVVDHLTLAAGLSAKGDEYQRRETSRLLHDAFSGGPSLQIPALCLAATSKQRPAVAGHLALLMTDAPAGSLEIIGLRRTAHWNAIRETFPRLSWAAVHATAHAIASDAPTLTADPAAYAGVPVQVIRL